MMLLQLLMLQFRSYSRNLAADDDGCHWYRAVDYGCYALNRLHRSYCHLSETFAVWMSSVSSESLHQPRYCAVRSVRHHCLRSVGFFLQSVAPVCTDCYLAARDCRFRNRCPRPVSDCCEVSAVRSVPDTDGHLSRVD
uniref:Putative secreted protein n=1 Tax=Anopheles marajoara TaxID=58244 RepID=A0A2M4C6P4_9DIPT